METHKDYVNAKNWYDLYLLYYLSILIQFNYFFRLDEDQLPIQSWVQFFAPFATIPGNSEGGGRVKNEEKKTNEETKERKMKNKRREKI